MSTRIQRNLRDWRHALFPTSEYLEEEIAMVNRLASTPTIWALLIGIDCYMKRTLDALPNYPNLGGCVNDILLMDEFLCTRLNVPTERIKKLTASGSGSIPKERKDSWPTKDNIVTAFQDLAQKAQPGDQVYIHYSGHGGRAITNYPNVKGIDGLDESLVPTDYGQIENKDQPEDRYVRDLELAALIQSLVNRQLIVTIVLDSCHSGGMARGKGHEEEAPIRGGLEADMIMRLPSELVAPPEALINMWQAQTRGTRSASLASGWLPDPEDYTLIAACRSLEQAREYPRAPNGKRQGYLSYWLWHALQSSVPNWQAVHQQVLARVHSARRDQTPQLQGMGDRAVFGGASLAVPKGITVFEVKGDRLRLNAGPASGIGVGAQLFVYRKNVDDFKRTDERVAVVQVDQPVVESGVEIGTESWANVARWIGSERLIEPGAQALLFDPGISQQRTVRLVAEGKPPTDVEKTALASLAEALEQTENGFVRLVPETESANFLVSVTDEHCFEIRDADGQRLPNVAPVPVSEPGEVVYYLTHLAKYFNVLELSNPDTVSRLAGKLEVTLMRTPEKPFNEPGGIPKVKHTTPGTEPQPEQTYYLRIRNDFDAMEGSPEGWSPKERRRRTMNVTVLNLSPDWGIQRFLPQQGEAEQYYDLEPAETLLLPRGVGPDQQRALPAVTFALPGDAKEALDIFKVFATTDATSYDSLLLPPLNDVPKRAALLSLRSPDPERSWTTAQVTVRVVK